MGMLILISPFPKAFTLTAVSPEALDWEYVLCPLLMI